MVGEDVEKKRLPPILLKFQGASVAAPDRVSCEVVVVAMVKSEIGDGVVVAIPTLSRRYVSPELVSCVDEA